MAVVASSLLRKVRKQHTRESLLGTYIKSGLVLRCDGVHNEDLERPDDTAIFICFPYLTLGSTSALRTHSELNNSERVLHRPTGLLQSMYDHDSARERDMDQTHRRFSKQGSKEVVQISQLWILFLGSGT
jgi:hypothetical protein